MNIFNNIGLGVATVGTVVASWFGYVPVKEQANLGASTQSSEVRALFTTTLANKITSSATSMTLSSATDKDGTVLASSTYGFIIDEGTSKEELVLADCTGTTCTNMTRGLSVRTGTTTVSALQFEHGRGAEIKITDAPALIYASNVFRGKQNLDYKLRYNTTQTFDNANDVISRSYADSLSFGAVPAASESASGFVELATGVETASSTSSGGTGARLAIPASLATSTYNSATAGLKVVVTQNDGKIDSNFIQNGSPIGSITAYSSTTAPSGWLLANGSAVSRATYSELYAIIGVSYGVGDGSTTFNLPNLTGRTIVMASTTQTATSTTDGTAGNRSTIGYKGGETMHTQTQNEVGAHSHTFNQTIGTESSYNLGSGGNTAYVNHGFALTVQNGGNSIPMNVLDPYIVLNYIIKY